LCSCPSASGNVSSVSDDGGGYITPYKTPDPAFWAHINNTEECTIVLQPPQPRPVGISLIPGYGWDVISDHSDDRALEEIIVRIEEAVEDEWRQCNA